MRSPPAAVGVPHPELPALAGPVAVRTARLPCRLRVFCSACSAGSVSGWCCPLLAGGCCPPPGGAVVDAALTARSEAALSLPPAPAPPMTDCVPSDVPLLARERTGEDRPSV